MWSILIYFHRVDLEYYFIHFAEKQVWNAIYFSY
jgi:hypothetical protein